MTALLTRIGASLAGSTDRPPRPAGRPISGWAFAEVGLAIISTAFAVYGLWAAIQHSGTWPGPPAGQLSRKIPIHFAAAP